MESAEDRNDQAPPEPDEEPATGNPPDGTEAAESGPSPSESSAAASASGEGAEASASAPVEADPQGPPDEQGEPAEEDVDDEDVVEPGGDAAE